MWRYMKVQLHVPVHVEVDEDAYFEIRKRKSLTEQKKKRSSNTHHRLLHTKNWPDPETKSCFLEPAAGHWLHCGTALSARAPPLGRSPETGSSSQPSCTVGPAGTVPATWKRLDRTCSLLHVPRFKKNCRFSGVASRSARAPLQSLL